MTKEQIQELMEKATNITMLSQHWVNSDWDFVNYLPDIAQTALEALQRVEELETELVKQTIGESIEDIREARIETRRKYPHLFNV